MKRFLFLLPLSFVFASCHFFGERVGGNGNITTENRSADGFRTIEVSGNIDVHITQDAGYSVRIEADQNLMEYIEVRTNGGGLWIGIRKNTNLDPSRTIKAYVSAPAYKAFKASGACHFYSDTKITSAEKIGIDLSGACGVTLDLKAPSVEAGLSGASVLDLKGETKELRIDGSGASEVRCFDLMAENVDIDLSGAGKADVFASVSLKVGVSGAGTVRYKGTPSVNQNISGAGSINKAD